MPHATHDASNGSICLCPTCVDDISLFVTSLTTLPQARAVTSHILSKHQSQLVQISALTCVLQEKDPELRLLRQQVEGLEMRLQEYEGLVVDGDVNEGGHVTATTASPSSATTLGRTHRRMSSAMSNASTHSTTNSEEESEVLTQIATLRQMLRSERRKEHPAAMRLRAAANEYANQAHAREMEAEGEAQEWMYFAEKWRGRVAELAECEQFLIDSQIWREMRECGCGEQELEMEMGTMY